MLTDYKAPMVFQRFISDSACFNKLNNRPVQMNWALPLFPISFVLFNQTAKK
jgi:hypothetical protein